MCIRDSFQGISFAVPSSTAEFVFEQLAAGQQVKRGYLGLRPGEISAQRVHTLGLPDHQGAYVLQVTNGSPAYRAGIRRDDILRRWQGVPIEDYRQVFRLAEAAPVGSEVALVIWRSNGQGNLDEHTFTVTIGQSSNPPLRTPSEFSRDR